MFEEVTAQAKRAFSRHLNKLCIEKNKRLRLFDKETAVVMQKTEEPLFLDADKMTSVAQWMIELCSLVHHRWLNSNSKCDKI